MSPHRAGSEPASETTGAGQDQVLLRIRMMLRERLQIEVVDPDLDLFESGVLDSLGLVELLLGLEAEFGVRARPDDLDLDNFRSLSSAAAFVSGHPATGGSMAS